MQRSCGLALSVPRSRACGDRDREPGEPAQSGSCAKANLNLVEDGQLSLATDNPAFPPWWGGAAKKPWEISNPASGKGYESAVAYAVAKQLGFAKGQVAVERGSVQQLVPARQQAVRLLHGAGLVRARAREERLLLELVLLRQPGGRRECRHADLARPDRRRPDGGYKLGAQVGTTSYSYITRFIRPSQSAAVYDSNNDAISALNSGQIDGIVVDLPTAFFVVAVQLDERDDRRQAPAARRARAVRHGLREGELARRAA